MSRLILALAVLVSACVQTGGTKVTAFRPATAPIYSAAAFAPARLQGRWTQVATFAVGDTAGCRAGGAEFTQGPKGLTLTARLCLNGQERRESGPVLVSGPGRITVPGMGEWWVVWVDSGYRTLAIGTPSGAFGFVLDRGAIPQDRLTAAAEILEFNGYPKTYLKPF